MDRILRPQTAGCHEIRPASAIQLSPAKERNFFQGRWLLRQPTPFIAPIHRVSLWDHSYFSFAITFDADQIASSTNSPIVGRMPCHIIRMPVHTIWDVDSFFACSESLSTISCLCS